MASMGLGARTKGTAFERLIVNDMNDVLGPWGIRVQRVPNSGGVRTSHRWLGDICRSDDGPWPLYVEAKKQEQWEHKHFLAWEKSFPPRKWWEKAVEDVGRLDLEPVLILGKNFCPTWVVLRRRLLDVLRSRVTCATFRAVLEIEPIPDGWALAAIRYEDFLAVLPGVGWLCDRWSERVKRRPSTRRPDVQARKAGLARRRTKPPSPPS